MSVLLTFTHSLTSNTVAANFWFFLETLKSKDLFENATKEVSSTVTSPGSHVTPPRFDMKKMLKLPLLQSIYAETLRMYVSVMLVRQTRQDTNLGQWNIPKKQKVMVCNYSEHMDERLWNQKNSPAIRPVHEFWGLRFLKYPETKQRDDEKERKSNLGKDQPRFSTEVSGCKWFPYGIGERMCPGRNFAKHQMLLTFALFSSTFDIELLASDAGKPKPDMKYFGYGVMPPEKETPFRIRRKVNLGT